MRRSELSSTLHSSHLSTWKNAYLAFTLMEIWRSGLQMERQDPRCCSWMQLSGVLRSKYSSHTRVYFSLLARQNLAPYSSSFERERVMQGKWIVTRNWRAGSITACRVVRRKASYAALVSLFFRHVIERPDKTISFRGEQSVPFPFRLRAFIMFQSLISRKGSFP